MVQHFHPRYNMGNVRFWHSNFNCKQVHVFLIGSPEVMSENKHRPACVTSSHNPLDDGGSENTGVPAEGNTSRKESVMFRRQWRNKCMKNMLCSWFELLSSICELFRWLQHYFGNITWISLHMWRKGRASRQQALPLALTHSESDSVTDGKHMEYRKDGIINSLRSSEMLFVY